MIRHYQEKDVLSCQHLLLELGYPSQLEELNERLSQLLDQPDYELLVYEEDGQVLGLIGYAKMYFFERKGAYLRILALVVDSRHRQKGIATALLDKVKHVAQKSGCLALALNSGMASERKTAHHFYERYGFEQASVGFAYHFEEK
ncbi:GNAT family N-acetyltransferase [Streptococcus cuniculi]|uniref:GNAT family N-acetyltransferase n=1 Tax=Streptococcus cuniculi TaxID=1432788 RepID=A0A1Q8E9T0_9STRE|nr:GNAT family N-acetyltransferase [Streptococcus cuniculi]OLF48548.1 GNAT family N-acetyltransferase [Streptococcus cuniculi]